MLYINNKQNGISMKKESGMLHELIGTCFPVFCCAWLLSGTFLLSGCAYFGFGGDDLPPPNGILVGENDFSAEEGEKPCTRKEAVDRMTTLLIMKLSQLNSSGEKTLQPLRKTDLANGMGEEVLYALLREKIVTGFSPSARCRLLFRTEEEKNGQKWSAELQDAKTNAVLWNRTLLLKENSL